MKNSWSRDEIYYMSSFFANGLIIFALIWISIYLVGALLNGTWSVFLKAITHYASWIAFALVWKVFSKRILILRQIRAYDFVLFCLFNMIVNFLWFRYPINLIVSVLTTMLLIRIYKFEKKRMNEILSSPFTKGSGDED